MSETVKYTGSASAAVSGETVRGLHTGAQAEIPPTHALIIIKNGVAAEHAESGKVAIFDGTEETADGVVKNAVKLVYISKAENRIVFKTPPIAFSDAVTGVSVSALISGECAFTVCGFERFFTELYAPNANADGEENGLPPAVQNKIKEIVAVFVTEKLPAALSGLRISITQLEEKKSAIGTRLAEAIGCALEEKYGLHITELCVTETLVTKSDYTAAANAQAKLGDKQAVCPKCGSKIGAASKFCSECGATLVERYCDGCGALLGAGDMFCQSCGRKVR